MATGSDRSDGGFTDYRCRLIAAALEIGAYLGEVEGTEAEAVATAAARIGSAGPAGWAEIYPAGPVRDYLRRSVATAASG